MSRIVIALGGNALGSSAQEQLMLVRQASKPIADLIEQGHELVLAHGNGPQVGMINLAFESRAAEESDISNMPFPECGAMSQGYIGFHLQNAIREELVERSIEKPVATVVTQVLVDKNDPAFKNPTKPIGAFYTEAEAREMEIKKGYKMEEDSGRGWRRVVPSPMPVDVIEKDTIRTLLDSGNIVITVGGGGIPVVSEGNVLKGVPAVIDKDYASCKVAELIDADYLFILTAVDRVAVNFGKPNQKNLEQMSTSTAYKYIAENQFAPGSMLPKVEAAIRFAESKKGRKAVIASLEKAKEALVGKSGTIIYSE